MAAKNTAQREIAEIFPGYTRSVLITKSTQTASFKFRKVTITGKYTERPYGNWEFHMDPDHPMHRQLLRYYLDTYVMPKTTPEIMAEVAAELLEEANAEDAEMEYEY